MEITRKKVMKLWEKRYGKETRVEDFSCRLMDKGAYGDRNSKFGWNIEHILPKSQGGKDSEDNLLCAHIKTNDEKADKFPAFVSNNKPFEIIKVQNHYEIKSKDTKNQENEEKNSEEINFFDHEQGIGLYEKYSNHYYFKGLIKIELIRIKETAIIDFINYFFKDYQVEIKKWYGYSDLNSLGTYIFTIKTKDLPTKASTQNLLDKCILLNTYLGYYFLRLNKFDLYKFFFGIFTAKNIIEFDNLKMPDEINDKLQNNKLVINNLVRINTEAEKNLEENRSGIYEYNYYYTNLKGKLENSK